MRTKILSTLALIITALSMMSYSTSSTNQTGDATGSPLSNGQDCYSCHNTGATRPVIIMYAKDANGTTVTSYIPGGQYTIYISAAQPTILYPTFGYQMCALTSDNRNAGTFTAATVGSQLTVINGISYAEHASPMPTSNSVARVQVNWTAPANTDKPVTFYGRHYTGEWL